jgi:2-keto-4-pentenoate hydratase/2-oxohepta-3-ene-1,7-dioic acid hydratase in catechol pathway
MKLVSFGPRGEERAGLLVGDEHIVDIASVKAEWPSTLRGLIERGLLDQLAGLADDAAALPHDCIVSVQVVRMGPPIPNPPHGICLGLNYRDHAQESGQEMPPHPILFSKHTSTVIGPYDEIVLPGETDEIDYEAELAAVISKPTRNIGADLALTCVAGYMAFNDVSARDVQFADNQWFRGKSFDTFAPCGPWLVTADEVPDPQALPIQSVRNGKVMQNSHTSRMAYGVADTIAFISRSFTLQPGDIIATGTPAGVGFARKPKVYLRSGDVIEVRIRGVGELRNPVTSEK